MFFPRVLLCPDVSAPSNLERFDRFTFLRVTRCAFVPRAPLCVHVGFHFVLWVVVVVAVSLLRSGKPPTMATGSAEAAVAAARSVSTGTVHVLVVYVVEKRVCVQYVYARQ